MVWINHIEMDCERIHKSISNFLPAETECDGDDDDEDEQPLVEKQQGTAAMVEKKVTPETIHDSDDDEPLSDQALGIDVHGGNSKGKGKSSKAKNVKARTPKKKANGKGNSMWQRQRQEEH